MPVLLERSQRSCHSAYPGSPSKLIEARDMPNNGSPDVFEDAASHTDEVNTPKHGADALDSPFLEDQPIADDVESIGTETLDKFLKYYSEMSQARSVVHKIEAKRYRKIDVRLIQIPSLLITTAVSILSFASQHTNNAQQLLFSIGCAQLVVSILMAIGTKFQFAKKSSIHATASNSYAKYCTKCESMLMKPPLLRPKNSRTLLGDYEKTYTHLVNSAPQISGWAQTQFKKKIAVPEGFSMPPGLLDSLYIVN